MQRSNHALLTAACSLMVSSAIPAQNPEADWRQYLRQGRQLHQEVRLPEAKKALKQALARAEKVGPQSWPYAIILNSLACVSLDAGHYQEAERFSRQSVQIAKELAGGEDHPDVAIYLTNLGRSYFLRGLHSRAEPLFRRALEIDLKLLAPAHPDTAAVQKNLADLLVARRQYPEAAQLYMDILLSFETTYGSSSSRVAGALNDLARLYQFQGFTLKAAPPMERAVEIWRTTLGLRHPRTAFGKANLAAIYCDLSRWDEAETLLKEALPILEDAYGSEHPDLGVILATYAEVLRKRGRKVEAREWSRRAKAIVEKSLQANLAARHVIDVRDLGR